MKSHKSPIYIQISVFPLWGPYNSVTHEITQKTGDTLALWHRVITWVFKVGVKMGLVLALLL
jgi:Ni,Fe-hydrogenase I cytochrome b subunit